MHITMTKRKQIENTYDGFRKTYGVLDSIRFAAREHGLKALDVAESVGKTGDFIRASASWC